MEKATSRRTLSGVAELEACAFDRQSVLGMGMVYLLARLLAGSDPSYGYGEFGESRGRMSRSVAVLWQPRLGTGKTAQGKPAKQSIIASPCRRIASHRIA